MMKIVIVNFDRCFVSMLLHIFFRTVTVLLRTYTRYQQM